jgi:hypothetical protein
MTACVVITAKVKCSSCLAAILQDGAPFASAFAVHLALVESSIWIPYTVRDEFVSRSCERFWLSFGMPDRRVLTSVGEVELELNIDSLTTSLLHGKMYE